jgi:hypothetical protein
MSSFNACSFVPTKSDPIPIPIKTNTINVKKRASTFPLYYRVADEVKQNKLNTEIKSNKTKIKQVSFDDDNKTDKGNITDDLLMFQME